MIPVRVSIGAFLVAAMAGCGSSTSAPTPPTPTTVTVTIPTGATSLGTAAWVPNPVTLSVVGSTVTWVNTDTASSGHDVLADNGSFDSGLMPNGARFSFTFQSRGTFPYHCMRHPGMVGTVIVQ